MKTIHLQKLRKLVHFNFYCFVS